MIYKGTHRIAPHSLQFNSFSGGKGKKKKKEESKKVPKYCFDQYF